MELIISVTDCFRCFIFICFVVFDFFFLYRYLHNICVFIGILNVWTNELHLNGLAQCAYTHIRKIIKFSWLVVVLMTKAAKYTDSALYDLIDDQPYLMHSFKSVAAY